MARLESMPNPESVAGMGRFGIVTARALGISVPRLRALAKEAGKDHALALSLWATGVHEARELTPMVDDPKLVTEEQMEFWVHDFDSWDVCDGCCGGLFDKTPFAYSKAVEWSSREREFVKRAAFSLMAALAVHDKKAHDDRFLEFLPFIERESTDNTNFVKKAVNWALRQIGKRNVELNREAIRSAERIALVDSAAARWVASDATRELTSDKVQARLRR